MSDLPKCPQCQSQYSYEMGFLLVCPECGHEWAKKTVSETGESEIENSLDDGVTRDAHGTELKDGDSVTVIKGLKVKGSSSAVKIGTKVKNIRLTDGDHDIDCKIDGFGSMGLKSEFVKKN